MSTVLYSEVDLYNISVGFVVCIHLVSLVDLFT